MTRQVRCDLLGVTFNHGVLGSIPSALTKKINSLDRFSDFLKSARAGIDPHAAYRAQGLAVTNFTGLLQGQ
jgi:hypothetical protein